MFDSNYAFASDSNCKMQGIIFAILFNVDAAKLAHLVNEKNQLVGTEDVKSFLSSLRKPLIVIGITGIRTVENVRQRISIGNRLLKLDVFSDALSHGLWVCYANNYLVILDTVSEQQTETDYAMLLTVLLASTLVVNIPDLSYKALLQCLYRCVFFITLPALIDPGIEGSIKHNGKCREIFTSCDLGARILQRNTRVRQHQTRHIRRNCAIKEPCRRIERTI